MSLLQKIYEQSPIFFQNFMTTILGYKKNWSRYGKDYYNYRFFLEEFDTYSLEEKLNYQKEKLITFINYANDNSEFYKKLYKNIKTEEINSIEDLKKLPIVDKELLRDNINNVNTIERKDALISHTGGTTGKSLEVFQTRKDAMERMAQLDHFKSKLGFENLKMRKATFSGNHIIPPNQNSKKYWRYNAASKQMLYSSFHITEDNLKYYVNSLNKFKPHALDGFFTSMLDVANYIERHNIRLEFQPIAIFPTSETLTNSGRKLLERVFKCKVYDQYASSEGAPFVTECENQTLHIELASGVFEHLEENNNEILVTSFNTHGTPLIRYRIGDSMIFEKTNILCECGSENPIVKEIQGRKLDFLYTSQGAKINSGNISNIFKKIPNVIIKAQLIQKQIGELNLLLEVDDKNYKYEYEEIIIEECKRRFGDDTILNIEYAQEIPREKSGKFQMIKNHV